MIQVGKTYIFTKSGNEVRVVAADVIILNKQRIAAFTVERLDSGKRMLVPAVSLKTRAESGLED
jgi:hypothetical protein